MDRPTLDHSLCLGEQPDGRQCVCRRYTKKPNQREEDPDICKNCGHIESGHPLLPPPPPTHFSVSNLVKDFREAGKVKKEPASTSELKASASTAHAETSEGLRKKRKSDTDTEPQVSNKKQKGKGKQKVPDDDSKKVTVGTVILKPEGLLTKTQIANGNLFELVPPITINAAYIDKLCSVRLGKMAKPGEELNFYYGWSAKQVVEWLMILFPEAMAWLAQHSFQPEGNESAAVQAQTVRLCIKTRTSLSLSHEPFPSGVEMSNACVAAGRSSMQRVLVFTSKQEIPEERYNDWDAESGDELEANSSEIEDENSSVSENVETPKKIKIVIKKEAVTKALAPAPATSSSAIATRLTTVSIPGTIAKKIVYVPDSDDEDYFPSSPFESGTVVVGNTAAPATSSTSAPAPLIPSLTTSPLFSSFASPSPPDWNGFNTAGDVTEESHEYDSSPTRNNKRWAAAALAASSSSTSSATGVDATLGFRTARPDPWA
ncbi:hypothetical protein B0H13DRAFT_1883526 [Mycena leptocephala]|nr:hypothetical protein B0H13DRAFT_1883526 [Mycena leptocephala]